MFEIFLYSFMSQSIPLKGKLLFIFIYYAVSTEYFEFWNVRECIVKIL